MLYEPTNYLILNNAIERRAVLCDEYPTLGVQLAIDAETRHISDMILSQLEHIFNFAMYRLDVAYYAAQPVVDGVRSWGQIKIDRDQFAADRAVSNGDPTFVGVMRYSRDVWGR